MSQDRSKDFWNRHSLNFLEMAMKRDYQETVHQSHGTGTSRRSCGDEISFYLMVEEGKLVTISYDLKGCLFSHACANTVIRLAKGKNIKQAYELSAEEIVNYLQTLPKEEAHCADHALKAFRMALDSL